MNIVSLFKIVPNDTLIKILEKPLSLNVLLNISSYKNAIEESIMLKEKLLSRKDSKKIVMIGSDNDYNLRNLLYYSSLFYILLIYKNFMKLLEQIIGSINYVTLRGKIEFYKVNRKWVLMQTL